MTETRIFENNENNETIEIDAIDAILEQNDSSTRTGEEGEGAGAGVGVEEQGKGKRRKNPAAKSGTSGKAKASQNPEEREIERDLLKRQKELTEEKIDELTAKNRIDNKEFTRADVVLMTLLDSAYMQGACADWPDIRELSRNALLELMRTITGFESYKIVSKVVNFYDRYVINVEHSVGARKRLAFFLSDLIGGMLENETYRKVFMEEHFRHDPKVLEIVVRGTLLDRIATPNALTICGYCFENEIIQTDLYRQRFAEYKLHVEEICAIEQMKERKRKEEERAQAQARAKEKEKVKALSSEALAKAGGRE